MALVRNCHWLRKIYRTTSLSPEKLSLRYRTLSSQSDAESLFIYPKVQELLKKMTGFNLDKILKAKPIAVPESPKYKLLTDEQLNQLQDDAVIQAQEYLQMPPYKKAWDLEASKNQILSNDPEIANFENSSASYVFTDVSPGLNRRDRTIVIRDAEGVLRLADMEERDRMLHVYYPDPEKMYKMPQMFKEDQLEVLLGQQSYEYILNRACLQFEPDDPNYTRVTQRTYEHISTTKQFEVLRSTRHFGPMTFYYVLYNKIDCLLSDMLSRDLFEDAVCLVQLHCLVHTQTQTCVELKKSDSNDDLHILQTYLKNDSSDKVAVEVALESYLRRNSTEDGASASN